MMRERETQADVVLASGMMNVATFRALASCTAPLACTCTKTS